MLDIDAEMAQSSSEDEAVEGIPHFVTYKSKEVAIPDDFLTEDPKDAEPITVKPIEWTKVGLPQNEGRYAVVLDHVLSPSECEALLRLVEQSVPDDKRGKSGDRFWRPAMVNAGAGYEVLQTNYRNSDRIIWDCQEVVDRLWARCARAPGIKEQLSVLQNNIKMLGYPRRRRGQKVDQHWEFRRLNKRMRFLKYGPGQFFRPHCDGPYSEPGEKTLETHFTIHLYLNDSKAEVGDKADLVGGATSFLSNDETKKVDVDPKAGRVLIFQHRGLYHAGDDVVAGTKYTMRTDVLYELIMADEEK